jgi:hypothetical protein
MNVDDSYVKIELRHCTVRNRDSNTETMNRSSMELLHFSSVFCGRNTVFLLHEEVYDVVKF